MRSSLSLRILLINLLFLLLSSPFYFLAITHWEKKISLDSHLQAVQDFTEIQASYLKIAINGTLCLLNAVEHFNDQELAEKRSLFESLPGFLSFTWFTPPPFSPQEPLGGSVSLEGDDQELKFAWNTPSRHFILKYSTQAFINQVQQQTKALSTGTQLDALIEHAEVFLVPQHLLALYWQDPHPLHAEISLMQLPSQFFFVAPVINQLNLVVAVKTESLTSNFTSLLVSFFLIFTALIFVGSLLSLWINLRMSRPLKALFATMQAVSAGDLSARFKTYARGLDVNQIGEKLNSVIDNLQLEVKVSQQERLDRELLQKELELARSIQQRLLPPASFAIPGIDIASATMQTQGAITGEFFDLFTRSKSSCPKESLLFTAIGESVANGISACLSLFCLRSILRSYAKEHDSLEKVMTLSNNLFYHDVQTSSLFATTFTCMYDTETHEIQYCCAGHAPALLIRHETGNVETLMTPGVAMGLFKQTTVPCHTATLHKEDLLFLYAEGLILAQNEQKEAYGFERLTAALQKTEQMTAQQIVDKVLEEVEHFCHPLSFRKDTFIIAIKVL